MRIVLAAVLVATLTGCATWHHNGEPLTDFERLPDNVQRAVWREIGDARIISARPSTLAGDPEFYRVDYVKNGERKSIKVRSDAMVMSKGEPGTPMKEAAGADRDACPPDRR